MPTSAAAAASAVVIIVTVALTVPEGTATDTKEVVGALSTAITSFLAAAFVTWTEDSPGSGLSDHIKEVVQDRYLPPRAGKPPESHFFRDQSRGDLLVYSDPVEGISGWGFEARHKRAKAIKREITSHTSDP